MQTENPVDGQTVPSSESGRGRWRLSVLVALLVVVLIVGTSAIVFAQQARQHGHAATRGAGVVAPPAGQWAAVLSNYEVTSLEASPANPSVLYACALPQGSAGGKNYTILRSSDYGTDWQDMGNAFGLGTSCDLAVNPANSSDLYVAGNTTQSTGASYMLWHSSDGGQTWTAISPSIIPPTSQLTGSWQVQQISIVGGRLYGMQSFSVPSGILQPPAVQSQTRLVMSTDGGQTWMVIDSHFVSTNLSVRGYAVDPSNTQTFYELVDAMFLPVHPGTQPAGTHAQPAFSYTVNLYKTTDGGATWNLLLGHLPFSTRLQLAGANPQVLYLGGSGGPLPYASNAAPIPFGSFQLQVSTDGGASWKVALSNSQPLLIKGWFVSPDGRAFLAMLGPSPTVVTTPVSANPVIRSYDPTSGTWSTVTTAPAPGMLIALTPAPNNGVVLWLLASNNTTNELYRYVV